MNLITRRGARLALGLIATIGLAGCQSYDMSDSPNMSASSTGQRLTDGYDRGVNRTAPYNHDADRRRLEAKDPAPKAAAPKPVRRATTVCAPAPKGGYHVSGLAFPTGDVNSSAIMVHQQMPDEVTLNSEFDYSYHLCNLTDGTLQNVVLQVEDTSNLRIVSSDPAGSSSGGRHLWSLGDLGPRETVVVNVRAVADSVGVASNCISVSYNNILCAQTEVVQPALQLTKTATERASLCDDIVYVFELRNTGTGVAKNVRLRDSFPNGVTAGGQNSIDVAIGDLQAGEAKRVTINAKADRTGSFDNSATAVADGGLTANSGTVNTVIVQPQLEISSDCTDRQFIGRNFTHSYTVRNSGGGDCANTVVSVAMPAGASFVRASSGGVQQGSNVVFNLDGVPAGAQRTVSVTMQSNTSGDYCTTATATCGCADAVQERCCTAMRGIPAILLEVIDIADPIEVGEQETYVITVTNQGSAADTNIRIVVTLPPEQDFVSAGGATSGSSSGRTVSFTPLPSLAPKAKAEWRVVVRATGAGDVRFATEMTSDQLTSPVRETEATQLYQ
ncbi:MAG: hypothetical protein DHS20C14_11670 [Phycisphaeraceae bacterium]|nr:MAG: hypothetical protein DHS20C14_11670 [Phycisphaeraceae bacterium]